MSIESNDSLNFSNMLSEMTEDLEQLDDFINRYRSSAQIYKKTLDRYKAGEATESDVEKAMDQFAFMETDVIRKASSIGGFTETVQSKLHDSRPEDVVGMARETVFMEHRLDEMSDNYSVAGDDFIESLEGFRELYENAVSKGESIRDLDREVVENEVDYSWRNAFGKVSDWTESDFRDPFDSETIAEKRNEIIAERPNADYIDFQDLSGTEDIVKKREEVLGITEEELEAKRSEVRSKEPRYIH